MKRMIEQKESSPLSTSMRLMSCVIPVLRTPSESSGPLKKSFVFWVSPDLSQQAGRHRMYMATKLTSMSVKSELSQGSCPSSPTSNEVDSTEFTLVGMRMAMKAIVMPQAARSVTILKSAEKSMPLSWSFSVAVFL